MRIAFTVFFQKAFIPSRWFPLVAIVPLLALSGALQAVTIKSWGVGA